LLAAKPGAVEDTAQQAVEIAAPAEHRLAVVQPPDVEVARSVETAAGWAAQKAHSLAELVGQKPDGRLAALKEQLEQAPEDAAR
jgi:hypothetical protein